MTPLELNRKGLQALANTLGYVDAVRFIKQFDNGQGDYTQERHRWLDHLTLEDIALAIHDVQSGADHSTPPAV